MASSEQYPRERFLVFAREVHGLENVVKGIVTEGTEFEMPVRVHPASQRLTQVRLPVSNGDMGRDLIEEAEGVVSTINENKKASPPKIDLDVTLVRRYRGAARSIVFAVFTDYGLKKNYSWIHDDQNHIREVLNEPEEPLRTVSKVSVPLVMFDWPSAVRRGRDGQTVDSRVSQGLERLQAFRPDNDGNGHSSPKAQLGKLVVATIGFSNKFRT